MMRCIGLGILALVSGGRADEWRVGPEKRLPAFREPETMPGTPVYSWQFAEGPEKWVPRGAGVKIQHDPDLGHGGKGCLRVKGVQEGGWNYVWSPYMPIPAGATYQASMWLRVESVTEMPPAAFLFKIELTPPKPKPGSRVNSSTVSPLKVGEWQQMTVRFSVPKEGLESIAFALEKGGRDRRTLDVAIDDVRLERIPDEWSESVWGDAPLKGPITGDLRGVHPRLYLDAERLAYLRAAAKDDPRWAPAMKTLLGMA
ncbi:MAG: hypothetical protein HN849_01915, partial [Victivallales bacterium]|nr:hypothetical protein [Victivallales bacterium]